MIAFRGDRASLPATAEFKKILFRQPVEPGPVKAGLRYNYYSGAFRMVNDFANLELVKFGITSNLTIGARESETYAEEPIIDNDGLHPAIERKKTMALKKGTYPIVVKYFQEGGTWC